MTSALDADEQFFQGLTNDLAPFTVPRAKLHEEPGEFPWYQLDAAGDRLVHFAHRFGSYDWTEDVRHDQQTSLLQRLAAGKPDDPVEGDYEFLWQCLFAVVRADHFNEGLVAQHLLALTRIANELRRRLIAQRSSPA